MFAFLLSCIYHYIYIQTLTKLDLQDNRIGDEGAKYLAQALEKNTVKKNITFFSIDVSNVDTHKP